MSSTSVARVQQPSGGNGEEQDHHVDINSECVPQTGAKKKKKKKKVLEDSACKQDEKAFQDGVVAGADDEPGAPPALADPAPPSSASKKSRKRGSPFRIKTGCIVALRPDSAGNHVTVVSEMNDMNKAETKRTTLFSPTDTSSYVSAWVSPVAGRDEGLSLIGKRVRCHFPKHLLQDNEEKRRVLEGEVVRLVDYAKRKPGKPWKIELLIHKQQFQHFEHLLVRVDEDVDESTLPNDKARRNHRNELRIRGPDKVVVKMRLLHPGTLLEHQTSNCVQWVIQKRVPAKLFQSASSTATTTTHKSASGDKNKREGEEQSREEKNSQSKSADSRKSQKRPRSSSTSTPQQQVRHVGDGNDSPEQQVANWRWLVSHYHQLKTDSVEDDLQSAPGFIGQVMNMEPCLSSNNTTLAFVTLRRLFLPEHTNTGRLSHHGRFEVFEQESSTQQQLIVRVEELIVVGASLHQGDERGCDHDPTNVDLFANFSYSIRTGVYMPLSDCSVVSGRTPDDDSSSVSPDSTEFSACHRCHRMIPNSQLHFCRNMSCEMYTGTDLKLGWCSVCSRSCVGEQIEDEDDYFHLPCCFGSCDCQYCRSQLAVDSENRLDARLRKKIKKRSTEPKENNRFFGMASGIVNACRWVDFELDSRAFLDVTRLPVPAVTACKRTKTKGKSLNRLVRKQDKNLGDNNGATKDPASSQQSPNDTVTEKEDFSVFKATCAREAIYTEQKQMKRPMGWYDTFQMTADVPRNLREVLPKSLLTETDPDDKTNASRAARAKQRRIFKAVSSFSGLGIDMLASRESQLRFGRSSIHAWGVFAEEDIQQGDLIVEYRGEIIGNARAEKREQEYERAKLGSDYMFRIDKDTVCDATKLGNVARFINASCDPNCYTKIITVEGNKRIVIYAKKDIREGEELCYDYKFPLEYDPKKRIPCHCGARNCRGFMNWDKRYVVESAPQEQQGKNVDEADQNSFKAGPGRLKNAAEQSQ